MNELKVFTQEEANQLLPVLIQLLDRLHSKRDQVAELEVQIDASELVSGTSSQELVQLMAKHRQLVAEFYDAVDQIHAHGCFLKDVDLGLIDFYGVVDGRIVYLCWRLGEERIEYWHEVDEGYTARQPFETE